MGFWANLLLDNHKMVTFGNEINTKRNCGKLRPRYTVCRPHFGHCFASANLRWQGWNNGDLLRPFRIDPLICWGSWKHYLTAIFFSMRRNTHSLVDELMLSKALKRLSATSSNSLAAQLIWSSEISCNMGCHRMRVSPTSPFIILGILNGQPKKLWTLQFESSRMWNCWPSPLRSSKCKGLSGPQTDQADGCFPLSSGFFFTSPQLCHYFSNWSDCFFLWTQKNENHPQFQQSPGHPVPFLVSYASYMSQNKGFFCGLQDEFYQHCRRSTGISRSILVNLPKTSVLDLVASNSWG